MFFQTLQLLLTSLFLFCSFIQAQAPEEAARLGRAGQRDHPELLTPSWHRIKVGQSSLSLVL